HGEWAISIQQFGEVVQKRGKVGFEILHDETNRCTSCPVFVCLDGQLNTAEDFIGKGGEFSRKGQDRGDEKLVGVQFGLECGKELRGFGCLRVCRKIHEKLLDLPNGLVLFSTADIEVDQSEGREIARKAAWEKAPDLLERLLVGSLAGQLANASAHVFSLVFASQG